jgi:hypothetical protein
VNWTPTLSRYVAQRFCESWRLLKPDDVLQDGDETALASLLLSVDHYRGFRPVLADEIGRTVTAALDGDGDRNERVYRRKA